MFNIQISNFKKIQKEEIEFVCSNWLPVPKKAVSMIVANGGIGKSWIIIQLALRHLVENKDAKVFAWLSEDPLGLSKTRGDLICSKILGVEPSSIKNLFMSDNPTFPINSNNINKLKEQLKDFDVILLDPLIGFYGEDENSNADARIFMQHFTKWASESNKTIIFVHHSGKGQNGGSRGASALVDAVRLVYHISVIKGDNITRKFTILKDNYGVKNLLNCIEFERIIFPKKPLKIIFEPLQSNIEIPAI